MNMTVHPEPQGSDGWLAGRFERNNAGDAAAMLGCDPNGRTRTELLDEMAMGFTPEVNAFKKRLFDKGHEVEAMLRPLAEGIIGEDLYTLVGSIAVEGLTRRVGASFDGVTIGRDRNFEGKLLNEALATALPYEDDPDANDAANLPKGYRVQLEQQLFVDGAMRTLFGAGRFHPDGTAQSVRWCWYESDPALRAEILAGWKQLEEDRATHVPTTIREMPKAEVTLALPALVIHAKGEITTSNMKEYGEALTKRLADVRAIQLITDQDFSNAKESAKLLRENIQQAQHAKDAMLAQTVTVGEAARMIDAWCEDMRLTALQLEKDVEREDKAKKVAMIDAAKVKYAEHVHDLEREIAPARLNLAAPVFGEAIKNKRSFASMQDALDTMLAAAKITANEVAATIRFNREQLRPQNGVEGEDWISLFPDFTTVCAKSRDDFHNLVDARVAAYKQRRQAERERIRKEEQERADREARERLAQEQRQAAQPSAVLPVASPAPSSQAVAANSPIAAPAVVQMRAAAAPSSPPTLRLGQINDRLQRVNVTAAQLEALGFAAAAREKGAVLFHESQYPQMLASIVAHLQMLDQQYGRAAA